MGERRLILSLSTDEIQTLLAAGIVDIRLRRLDRICRLVLANQHRYTRFNRPSIRDGST